MSTETRTRLVEATRELLWDRGYAATSPKDILRRADAGQGSMYHHFAGKQELAVAALEENAAGLRAEVAAVVGSDAPAVDVVIAYLTRERDALKGCPMGRMTYDADVLATPELLRPASETLAWIVDELTTVIERGVHRGELSADTDAHALASAVGAVVQGGYVLARAQQDASAFDAAVAGAVALLRQAAHR